jgi:outer membrane lipoprotein-sorting protein
VKLINGLMASGLAILITVGNAAETPQQILQKIADLTSKVQSYKATIEVHDKSGQDEMVASSTLTVSREYGWKVEDNGGTGHVIYNDFKTSYEYFPDAHKAMKFTATTPEIEEGFSKPAREMNPALVLDPNSVKLIGNEMLDAEPVYHLEGTTTTQFINEGKPVTRRIEAWVSSKDGMIRKTIEYTEDTVGTTLYKNVQVNIPVKASDFKFVAPPGVEVTDINAEMKKQRENQPTRPPDEPAKSGEGSTTSSSQPKE